MASVSSKARSQPLLVLMHALRLAEGRHGHLGGNYYHVQHLAKAIAATNQVRLVVLTDSGSHQALQAAAPGLDLLPVGSEAGGILAADRHVVEACRRLQPDIYHRPTGQLPFSRLPCQTVVSIADLNFRTLPMPWTRRLYKELSYRWTVRRADRITCVSAYTRDEVIRHLHVPAERLAVIHHGASELPAADPAFARSIGAPFWLTFGHQAHKNVETCLAALVAGANRGEKLVVVGQSGHIDGVLRPEVARRGLDQAVVFAGRVSDSTLRGLYEQALGLLFLSRYEGFGLPILEAMACGCPVISSNACSLPEVAGDAALLFHPDDFAGVAGAMAALAGDPKQRGDLAARGRKRAEQFTWERAAAETVKVYKSVMTSSTS